MVFHSAWHCSLTAAVVLVRRVWIFPSIFYYHYLVVKTQFLIEFRNWIQQILSFYQFIFHCNCQSSISNTLYTRKTLQKRIYISCFCFFYSRSEFFSNLAGFEFLQFFLGYYGVLWVSLTSINSNHKTQSSKQKWR